MSIEKDLQQLKEQSLNETVKQQNINRIAAKLQQVKRITYAKTAMVTFAMMALLFVLLISVTERVPETATTLQDEKEIASMYVQNAYDSEYNVTPTIFRVGIIKMKEESVRLTEDFLAQLEVTPKPEHGPNYYSLIEWTDGTSTQLEIYNMGDHVIFYDYGNETFYRSLTPVEGISIYGIYEPRSSGNRTIWMLVLFIPLLAGQFYIDQKLKDSENPDRKIARVSTPWQVVLVIAFIVTMLSSVFLVENLHLFWILILIFVYVAIFIWLEMRNGQNKWRIMLVLLQSLGMIVYTCYFTFPFF